MSLNLDNMDQLIERYTSGAMSPVEERAFLAQAGQDPKLRELLNAEQAIQSAFQKERTHLFASTAGAYERFVARTGPVAPTAAPTAPAVLGIGKYVAVVLGVAGLTVGAFFVAKGPAPVSPPVPTVQAKAPVIQHSAETPATDQQINSADRAVMPSEMGQKSADTDRRSQTVRHLPAPRSRNTTTIMDLRKTTRSPTKTTAEKPLKVVTTDKATGTADTRDAGKK